MGVVHHLGTTHNSISVRSLYIKSQDKRISTEH